MEGARELVDESKAQLHVLRKNKNEQVETDTAGKAKLKRR